MFIPIDVMLKMIGKTVADPKNHFLNMGMRVFDDNDGELYLMKNAAILYVRHTYDRVRMLNKYYPQDAREGAVRSTLLGPMDEEFNVIKEVKK